MSEAESPLRFAVVGCGVIGRHHAAVITGRPDAELAAVVDPVPSAADELAAQYGVTAYNDLGDVLARDDIDGVALCTPSGDHAEQAVLALRAGKHVVIEKPLDVDLVAAARLAEVANRSTASATVISQHRFDPATEVVRAAVESGKLGRLTSAVASVAWWRSQSYYDSGAWRGTKAHDGGGALINQSIHTIDLLIWLLGDPVEVTAYSACLAHDGLDVEDTAVAVIRFDSGALAVVHGTTAAYPGTSARLQVHGTHGSAIIDDDRLVYFHAGGSGAEAPAYGGGDTNQAALVLPAQDTGPSAGAEPSALSNAHSLQYADFLTAIRTGTEPLVTIAEATKTLAVILAIYDSAARHVPVPIPSAASTGG
ncbi:hypothetical protein BWI15_01320 [Kribbella sp. ALI-6-A]|uniref:Gfo/Idh/MocA family protein n=1 Tax=Kribbella sp. ALI-6-A TaxID=1933817 RepID=UPI00097C5D49|nr:Gfo/Idh/MocA family oxidoreductase [Kribbella sp. ALI-6-A]ONI78537.1 hypothetical protein BWI15_01320 [Kribbella sp. ALI-6-A]